MTSKREMVNGPEWPDDPDGDLAAEVERVYGEYHAAREAYEKVAPETPQKRGEADPRLARVSARFEAAKTALREHRRQVREMQTLEADLRGEPRPFVRVENETPAPPPDTVRHVDGQPWTERRFSPKGA